MYYNPYVFPYQYQYPYYVNVPMYNEGRQSYYSTSPNEKKQINSFYSFRSSHGNGTNMLTDYGPRSFVVNINEASKQNNTFRTALWTGKHLDRKSTRLNSSHVSISYAVFCLKKKRHDYTL